jgi:hypothetical protein
MGTSLVEQTRIAGDEYTRMACSYRRTIIGSTIVARRAGRYAAASAVAVRNSVADT